MTTVTVGTLLREGFEVLGRQWRWLVAGGVVIAAGQAAQLGLRGHGAGFTGAMGLLAMLMQYVVHAVVTRRLLLGEGLTSAAVPARYGNYMLAALAVVLGGFVGALVLVFPGIMLLLRWSLSTSFTLARGMTAREALAASRDATKGHRWVLLGAWAVLWGLLLLPYGALIWSVNGFNQFAMMPVLSPMGVVKLVWTALATCGSLAFAVGAFSVLVGRSDRLSEIFA